MDNITRKESLIYAIDECILLWDYDPMSGRNGEEIRVLLENVVLAYEKAKLPGILSLYEAQLGQEKIIIIKDKDGQKGTFALWEEQIRRLLDADIDAVNEAAFVDLMNGIKDVHTYLRQRIQKHEDMLHTRCSAM